MYRAIPFLLVLGLLHLTAAQPLYGFEKALLYSFEDPSDIEWTQPVKERQEKRAGARYLNLIGQNTRFLKPFIEKKEREEKIKAAKAAKLEEEQKKEALHKECALIYKSA